MVEIKVTYIASEKGDAGDLVHVAWTENGEKLYAFPSIAHRCIPDYFQEALLREKFNGVEAERDAARRELDRVPENIKSGTYDHKDLLKRFEQAKSDVEAASPNSAEWMDSVYRLGLVAWNLAPQIEGSLTLLENVFLAVDEGYISVRAAAAMMDRSRICANGDVGRNKTIADLLFGVPMKF